MTRIEMINKMVKAINNNGYSVNVETIKDCWAKNVDYVGGIEKATVNDIIDLRQSLVKTDLEKTFDKEDITKILSICSLRECSEMYYVISCSLTNATDRKIATEIENELSKLSPLKKIGARKKLTKEITEKMNKAKFDTTNTILIETLINFLTDKCYNR